jgi:hypothetical protein
MFRQDCVLYSYHAPLNKKIDISPLTSKVSFTSSILFLFSFFLPAFPSQDLELLEFGFQKSTRSDGSEHEYWQFLALLLLRYYLPIASVILPNGPSLWRFRLSYALGLEQHHRRDWALFDLNRVPVPPHRDQHEFVEPD